MNMKIELAEILLVLKSFPNDASLQELNESLSTSIERGTLQR